ncbi:MAG: nitroreductase [Pseudomonadota bacterium]
MRDIASINYHESKSVSDAVTTRRSLRAFLSTPVDSQIINEILEKAARAPSGTNMQPWQVYVVTGSQKQTLCDSVCDAFDTEKDQHEGEVRYYPEKWFEPFISRRRKVGWDLYGLLGINKGERDKMHTQHRRNFRFFDAPVGMIFTIHRHLATGSWLDYGMFLQNIMLLAREVGLHTCPQAAWSDFHRPIRSVLPLADDEIVVCGMAVGYADESAIENSLVTERAQVSDFVRFFD